MRRHFAVWAIAATAALGTTACSSAEAPVDQDSTKDNAPSATAEAAASPASDTSEGASVEILDSGFGQNEYGTQGIAVVTTDDEAAVGEMVTVTANFMDAEGQIIATEEQVESFGWVGQELVLPISVFIDDPAVKVDRIDVSASLSDYGSREAKDPLPVLEAAEVKAGQYGGHTAAFEFTNESGTDLEDLRVGVVCYDASAAIIGGTSTYPSLVPAGKTIRIEADPTVSDDPASCKAFLGYGVGF